MFTIFWMLLEWGLYLSEDSIKISNFWWGLYSSRDTIRDGTVFKTLRYNFYYALYGLKCILKATPENLEHSGKISEHLCTCTPMGKAYKPTQNFLQNYQQSRRSCVSRMNHDEKPSLEPLQLASFLRLKINFTSLLLKSILN